ncbi:MAG: abortive infection family protein [Lentisphaerae bacterium]|nr:abortive infection family protein [Lentisphaerota bacterium]
MSSLSMMEKRCLEEFLGMSSGYVLTFSDRTLGEFVFETIGVDIHSERYTTDGTSKAKKLRVLWKLESDHMVGALLNALVEHGASFPSNQTPVAKAIADKCRQISTRLLAGASSLAPLKNYAKDFNATYLSEQIRRMESSIQTDPSLAIGTAKELIETCCKTILCERGISISASADIPTLTKQTLKELNLVPEGVPETSRGADVIKRLLSNLGTIGNGLAELRGLYGTGHGKHGSAMGLMPRHAKFAVGVAATLATFLFDSHQETKSFPST